MPQDRVDFFVSYTQADKAWAEWIAWELEAAGYETTIQAWDFVAGRNFADLMDRALTEARHTVAVLSPDYLKSDFARSEWLNAFAQDPTSQDRKLIPVRVRKCDLDGLLTTITYADLVDLSEAEARERLLRTASGERLKPDRTPPFPRATPVKRLPHARAPRFPGLIRRIPHRQNPDFVGREKELTELHEALQSGTAAITQAIHGLGGVGKTHLAVEYLYRHLHEYDVVWWLLSEKPESLRNDFLALGMALGVPEAKGQDADAAIAAIRRRLEDESRWLLVFDNAEEPGELKPYLPKTGNGACLVTSRTKDWRGLAQEIPLTPFPREESLEFLRQTRRESSKVAEDSELAERLADELGDLPLALEQAVAYLQETGMAVDDYLELVKTRWKDIMGLGFPKDRADRAVAATWQVSVERLEQESEAGLQLLEVLAWLAPDDVPLSIFQDAEDHLPSPLSEASKDPIALHEAVGAAARLSLLESQDGRLSVHRLVQSFARERLRETVGTERLGCAVLLVNQAFPYKTDDPETWAASGVLVQHAVSVLNQAIPAEVELEIAARLSNELGLYLKNCLADLDQALFHLKRSLSICEVAYGPDHNEVAIRANNIALILQDQGDLSGALEYAERALSIDETVYGSDHPEVAVDVNNIALILQAQGDLSGALKHARRALSISESVYETDHPTVAISFNSIGQILKAQGDLSGALGHTQRALEIGERVYGSEHPEVAVWINNIGQILKAQGDLPGALEYAERALSIQESVYGPDHPTVAIDANNIALILQAQGDLSGALEYAERALSIGESVHGPDHPTVAIRANNIAMILQAQGDLSRALEYAERALSIGETVYGPEHPTVAIRANNIGLILQDQGDLEAAETWLERALGILERTYGPENPRTQIAARNLENVREELGRG